MSLLDSAMAATKNPDGFDPSTGAAAAVNPPVAAPAPTAVDGSGFGGAPASAPAAVAATPAGAAPTPAPAPAPAATAALTPSPTAAPSPSAAPSLMDSASSLAASSPAASASFSPQAASSLTASAAAAPYSGGTSYKDYIAAYQGLQPPDGQDPNINTLQTAQTNLANLDPVQAKTDFANAIGAGQEVDGGLDAITALGVPAVNEIVPANDLHGIGFNVDALYGSDLYKNYAQTLGAQLGLTSDQIAKAVGSVMGPAYQASLSSGQVIPNSNGNTTPTLAPFELGNTPLAQQFTNAIYAAAGKTPDPDQQAMAQKLDGYYSQLRAVPGHTDGVFGGGLGAFLALAATGGLASTFLAPAVAADGALAGGAVGGAAVPAAAADSIPLAAGSVVDPLTGAITGGVAGSAGATALAPVAVTGAAATGLTAAQVAAGAVAGTAAGNAIAQTGGSGTASDPTTLETQTITSPIDPPAPLPPNLSPLLNLLPLPTLQALTPQVASQVSTQLQNANLNPDQSKWNLSDWQTYLRIASGIAGLLGSGSSSTAAPAPAASGSIQVPTTTPFVDPTAQPSSATGSSPSLFNAAQSLQMPTTDYAAGSSAITNPVAATPAASQTATAAGYTPGATANANLGAVTADQTVADRLTKLVAANSPYIDQARQRAIQAANARGLQNSTIAGQSGEEAAISQALPIAQQDAATYQKQSLTNQAAQDTASALNENIRESDNATGVQQASLAEQQRQFNTSTDENAAKLAEDAREFNDDAAQKDRLAQLDTNTKAYLANVQSQYQTQTQTSASATDLFNTFQNQVALIATSANMDAANKQAAINIAASNLKSGMAVLGSINGLDLSSILNFSGSTA